MRASGTTADLGLRHAMYSRDFAVVRLSPCRRPAAAEVLTMRPAPSVPSRMTPHRNGRRSSFLLIGSPTGVSPNSSAMWRWPARSSRSAMALRNEPRRSRYLPRRATPVLARVHRARGSGRRRHRVRGSGTGAPVWRSGFVAFRPVRVDALWGWFLAVRRGGFGGCRGGLVDAFPVDGADPRVGGDRPPLLEPCRVR